MSDIPEPSADELEEVADDFEHLARTLAMMGPRYAGLPEAATRMARILRESASKEAPERPAERDERP